jgi:phosphate starvation-inducible PhoH-like protein
MILDDKIMTLPLAFMRGYTFKNAFVLLDECQNTTPKQMKMFLTRIGENSKVVMTGDPNQSDIRGTNGLVDIVTRLDNVPNVGIVKLGMEDVIRHEIVKMVEKKYYGV